MFLYIDHQTKRSKNLSIFVMLDKACFNASRYIYIFFIGSLMEALYIYIYIHDFCRKTCQNWDANVTLQLFKSFKHLCCLKFEKNRID